MLMNLINIRFFFPPDSAKHIYNIKPNEEYTAPKFTKLLTDVLVREGDEAVLECAVSGHPEPEVKWFLNKSEIIFSNRIKVFPMKFLRGTQNFF